MSNSTIRLSTRGGTVIGRRPVVQFFETPRRSWAVGPNGEVYCTTPIGWVVARHVVIPDDVAALSQSLKR